MKKQYTVLLIGPLPNIKANKVGGARVLFSELVDYFEKNKLPFVLINTKKFDLGFKRFLNPLFILFYFFKSLKNSDVIFVNVSQGGAKTLAPFISFFTKLFNKKFIFRPFGGSLKDHYEKYSPFQKWLFDQTILQADILFLETAFLLDFFKKLGANAFQLPNSREIPEEKLIKKNPAFNKRFVFVSHVKKSKGIDIILQTAKLLDSSYTIHIYGPIKEPKYKKQFQKNPAYKGVLAKEKVAETLSNYDVLILPTFFEGEGYPGVIIEAYALGLPVITTRWKSIPEMVIDNKTALLIDPKSEEALLNSILFFNKDNYPYFSREAHTYFKKHFLSSEVHGDVIRSIDLLF